MNENQRLLELRQYNILDTPPEQYLDELAEIASAICETPISLLSLIDQDRQWFKANKGLKKNETPRSQSFCQHTLHNPREVLVIEDSEKDSRFMDNPLVTGDPNIRFYAGAPLVTSTGSVLGTLCIIDRKPRSLSVNQKNVLQLLANKAMEYLETRKALLQQGKFIENNSSQMKKLTDLAPGVIFQLELTPEGKLFFPFISQGIKVVHPTLDPKELKINAEICYSVVHPEDLEMVQQSLGESCENLSTWDIEYRVSHEEGKVSWHRAHAIPEKRSDGSVVWYGTFQDVTPQRTYIETLERILFDISHVMRKPVTTMMGLTEMLNEEELDEEHLRLYSGHMKTVAGEMDHFIRKLNDDYAKVQKYFLKEVKLNNS